MSVAVIKADAHGQELKLVQGHGCFVDWHIVSSSSLTTLLLAGNLLWNTLANSNISKKAYISSKVVMV